MHPGCHCRPTTAPWHRFVRGAVAGNFLHEQLEWLAGEGFALATQPALAERLRRRCERSPYAPQADDVVAWLTALVPAPLPHLNARLDCITTCLPEMAFGCRWTTWRPTIDAPPAAPAAQRAPARCPSASCTAC
jgi:exodeoxyribonuclease V beta subunit